MSLLMAPFQQQLFHLVRDPHSNYSVASSTLSWMIPHYSYSLWFAVLSLLSRCFCTFPFAFFLLLMAMNLCPCHRKLVNGRWGFIEGWYRFHFLIDLHLLRHRKCPYRFDLAPLLLEGAHCSYQACHWLAIDELLRHRHQVDVLHSVFVMVSHLGSSWLGDLVPLRHRLSFLLHYCLQILRWSLLLGLQCRCLSYWSHLASDCFGWCLQG